MLLNPNFYRGNICYRSIFIWKIIKPDFSSNIDNRKKNLITVVADNNQDDLLFAGLVIDTLKLKYYLADNGKIVLDLVYKKS